MPENATLQNFQDALLELLSSGKDFYEIVETLNCNPNFDDYREYVDEFDPDMIEVARELMGKWAQRADETEHPPDGGIGLE